MDLSKKRKADNNGGAFPAGIPAIDASAVHGGGLSLSLPDVRKILEPFSKDQLIDILQSAVIRDATMLAAVRSVADSDATQRKLYIRGLGWETTTDKLRSIFSAFGELDEAIVITVKATGKSKGYGFVIYKHIDGAILALKEPNKKIDGRMVVAQLAAARESAGVDVSMRKIYVGNVPFEITSERLLSHFASYGDIEEGPLGFDKQSGKQKGFAFFVYKTEEGARASLVDPVKTIDGHQLLCKFATDGKKGKPGVGGVQQGLPGKIYVEARYERLSKVSPLTEPQREEVRTRARVEKAFIDTGLMESPVMIPEIGMRETDIIEKKRKNTRRGRGKGKKKKEDSFADN